MYSSCSLNIFEIVDLKSLCGRVTIRSSETVYLVFFLFLHLNMLYFSVSWYALWFLLLLETEYFNLIKSVDPWFWRTGSFVHPGSSKLCVKCSENICRATWHEAEARGKQLLLCQELKLTELVFFHLRLPLEVASL